MKNLILRIFSLLSFMLISVTLFAQAPQKMTYQAVMRDANEALLKNTNIGLQISILQSSSTGTAVYTETQVVTSNDNGLISLEIGDGTLVSGNFSTIDWGNNTYFVKTEVDPNGGTNYSINGTSQLLSVPYALYANNSGSSIPGPQGPQGPISATSAGDNISVSGSGTTADPYIIEAIMNEVDGDTTNEIQDLLLAGNMLSITNNSTATVIDLSPYLDNTDTQLTEAQVDAFASNNGYLLTEIDGSITNEIQDLQLAGNNLSITNNGAATVIDLSPYLDNTDTQLTEAQVDAFANNNGYLLTEIDGSISNEIQDLQLAGNNLTITNNGTATVIDLSPYLDNTDTQLTEAQVDAFANNNGYLLTEIDGSITNEIQTLSRNGDSITLSDGGTVNILDGDTTHWKENVNGIHNTNSWIGIGTSSPFYRLSIVDDLSSNNGRGVNMNFDGGNTPSNYYLGMSATLSGGTAGNHRAIEANSNSSSSGANIGVLAFADSSSTSNFAIVGSGKGQNTLSNNAGVLGEVSGNGDFNSGVLAQNFSTGLYNFGLRAFSTSLGNGTTGANIAVFGSASNNPSENYGVYGYSPTGANNYAGFFDGAVTITGDLNVTGNIAKGGGTFKIDHPLEPADKYLIHSFVESPEMLNIYSGNITTDANNKAIVTLPDYFEASNKEYRYQLTVIGAFAQAIILEEISANTFVIATDAPNVKVSWEVTAVRADKYADANRIIPVVNKETKGTYIHPELYGVSKEKGVNFKHLNPNMVSPSSTEIQPSNTSIK